MYFTRDRLNSRLMLVLCSFWAAACGTSWEPVGSIAAISPRADRIRVTTSSGAPPNESDSLEVRGDTLVVWERVEGRYEPLRVVNEEVVSLEQGFHRSGGGFVMLGIGLWLAWRLMDVPAL